MGVRTAHPTTLVELSRVFYREASDASKASDRFPIGSEGRDVLGILARAIERMGVRFDSRVRLERLREMIEQDIALFAYGEDPGDRHSEEDKQFARQQLLVDRLALERLGGVSTGGRQ